MSSTLYFNRYCFALMLLLAEKQPQHLLCHVPCGGGGPQHGAKSWGQPIKIQQDMRGRSCPLQQNLICKMVLWVIADAAMLPASPDTVHPCGLGPHGRMRPGTAPGSVLG